jgi:hypothetical protein
MPPQPTGGPLKRASCAITKPYIRKPKVAKVPYKSSTQPKPPVHKRIHLTLSDWLHVVEWYDQNQPVSQDATVKHFRNLREGALIFDQASLSCHLTKKGRQKDQERLAATPTALSAKKARIVTRPDMEEALRLWVEHMEQRCETVTGAMLVEKRARFEDKLNVPENERLRSGGWVQKFLRT